MSTTKGIKSLIEQGEIEQALKEFLKLSKEKGVKNLEDDLTIIKIAFENSERRYNRGSLDYNDYLKDTIINTAEKMILLLNKFEKVLNIQEEPCNPENRVVGEINSSIESVLFLASNPFHEARLQLEREFIGISRALKEEGERERAVELNVEWAVNSDTFQQALLRFKPTILHFSGHGVASQGQDVKGGIFLNNAQGNAVLVDGEVLGGLLEVFNDKYHRIRAVVLNACYSDDQAEPMLKHVDHVIGMRADVPDEVAIVFSKGLYRALSYEDDIKYAFKIAKNLIALEGLSKADMPILRSKSN